MSIAYDLSNWHFNIMCVLGDEENNRKIRQKRENEREEHKNTDDIKLWGIWYEYRKKIEQSSEDKQPKYVPIEKPKREKKTEYKVKKGINLS